MNKCSILFLWCRVYPFLCRAVRNFVKDQAEVNLPNKEYFLALTEVPSRLKVRELSTFKAGTLIRISGQVRDELLALEL